MADDFDYEPSGSGQADHEEELEEAQEDGYRAGYDAGQTKGFWIGLLSGMAVMFVLIGMGWCAAPRF